MVRHIKEEKLISIPEVKEILDDVVARLTNMNIELKADAFQEATIQYVNHFAKMSAPVARKVIKMLMADYKMGLSQAIQIVNINPNYPQEVKIILDKDPNLRSLEEDDLKIMIQKIRDLQA